MNLRTVMLAEGIRKSVLEHLTRIPPLLLPLRPGCSLAELWAERLSDFVNEDCPLEVLVSSLEGHQSLGELAGRPGFARAIDPRPHRGTGGALLDHLMESRADLSELDYVLVIEGGACPPRSLTGFFQALSRTKPDVLVGVSDYDRLAGIMAIHPSVLELIPAVGFCDLKEQTLNKLVKTGGVIVAQKLIPRAIRLGSLPGWIQGVSYHQPQDREIRENGRLVVRGSCCIDSSAEIGDAVILDSIVMQNTTIGDGAVIARSAICPGSIVPPGTRIIDSIVSDRIISVRSRNSYSGRLP